VPTVITRQKFRHLIDPLLYGLGLEANDVRSCQFDADGFELVVFEKDGAGQRISTSDGIATQQVRVRIADGQVLT
jgi:hypothetical protein